MSNEPDFITPREAAKELKLSYSTVLGLIKHERISYMRFGRSFRFRRDDLIAFGYKNGSGRQINKHYGRHV